MIQLESKGIDVLVWIECDRHPLSEYNLEANGPRNDQYECWVPSEEDKVCAALEF